MSANQTIPSLAETATSTLPTQAELDAAKTEIRAHIANLDAQIARLVKDRQTLSEALAKLDNVPIAAPPPPESEPAAADQLPDTVTETPNPEPANLPSVPAWLPTIVRVGDDFVELRCDACGANAYANLKGTTQFLKGVGGFAQHRRGAHRIAYSLAETLEACEHRKITPGEMRAIVRRGSKKHGVPFVVQPAKRKRGVEEPVGLAGGRPRRVTKRIRNAEGAWVERRE
ncbi:hypothetical protein BU16DRAFT_598445 [Lophium mytilinum]|uniref:Uncharacterized protein n=1 Tax=Lophium mytilinum TaxID=390894 RepID=A0A6A6QBL5_9PEZI|nr:hypothetical protein BU16DRAFT_598445 [Lophium mytilinum]